MESQFNGPYIIQRDDDLEYAPRYSRIFSAGRWWRDLYLCFCTAALLVLFAFAGEGQKNKPQVPAYPIEGSAPQFPSIGVLPSVEFVGLDLAQNGTRFVGPVPAISAGAPLEITLHLRPISALVDTRRLRVNIRPPGVGPAPGFLEYFDFGIRDWQFRELYKQSYQMNLPLRQFVGRGVLSISEMDPEERDWRRGSILFAMPVEVPARVSRSNVDDARLRDAFGDRATSLHAAFTLAPGTQVTVPVEATEKRVTGIGILSYVSWHESLSNHETLARVTLRYPDRSELQAQAIAFGDSTYKAVVVATGNALEQGNAEIAWSDPIEDEVEGAQRRCMYKGVLPVSDREECPSEIDFEYCADGGMLDFFDVVLLDER